MSNVYSTCMADNCENPTMDSDYCHEHMPVNREREFISRLAAHSKSHEPLMSTWNPPEWDDLVDLWDEFVEEARTIVKEQAK